jgi:hypothetical protein
LLVFEVCESPTAWALINKKCAYANDVFSVNMRKAVDALLLWECGIYAEVPIHPKQRLDAKLLPMPLGRAVEAVCHTRECLTHNPFNPSSIG